MLGKLLEVEGFDFKGLQIEEIREAIKIKKNYSFVIGYELLLKDYIRETTPVESHTNQLYFGPIKDYLDLYQREIIQYYEGLLSEGFQKSWIYGVRLHYEADDCLNRVIQILIKLNIAFVIKSTSYNVKCYFNPLGEVNTNEQMAIEESEALNDSPTI